MRLLFDLFKNDKELYWAAGFFDGEGYIGVTTQRSKGYEHHRIACSIAQTTLEPLQRFQLAVKAGSIYGPYDYAKKANNTNKKIYWQFNSANTDESIRILNRLSPYLTAPKLVQFQTALEKYKGLRNESNTGHRD